VDIAAERTDRLKDNMRRVGADNVTVKTMDVRELKDEQFDRIIIDAPCSSTGLLRKQPDVRWRRKSHHIAAQHRQQVEILDSVSELVKPGGIVVYSTCSILAGENHEVVNNFLRGHPEFQKEDARGFLPDTAVGPHGDMETFTHVHDTDGAYASRLRRIP
jgi:16S rRNA (cytosine967-C5)-methyltransferase